MSNPKSTQRLRPDDKQGIVSQSDYDPFLVSQSFNRILNPQPIPFTPGETPAPGDEANIDRRYEVSDGYKFLTEAP